MFDGRLLEFAQIHAQLKKHRVEKSQIFLIDVSYLSAEEYTATVAMPNFLQVRMTRNAISPLLAIKTLRMGRYDALLAINN